MNIKYLLLLLFFNLQLIKAQNEFIDTSFGTNAGYSLYQNGIYDLTFADIVDVNGYFYTSEININGDWFLSKFDSNGMIDSTFGVNGRMSIIDNDGWTINTFNRSSLMQTNDNKLFLITGSYSSNAPEKFKTVVTKINLDGTIDITYGINGKYISTLPLGFDLIGTHKTDTDEIIAIGYNTAIYPNDDTQKIIIIKITNQGILDNTFGDNGKIELSFQYQTDTPVQAIYKNQGIYILFNNPDVADAYMKKYNLDILNYDLNFGTNGTLEINNSISIEDATTFMLDNNDNIYAAGSMYNGNNLEFDLFIYKYSNNFPDSSFGNNGIVNFQLIPNTNSIAIPSSIKVENDKILLMGHSYNWDAQSYDKTFLAQFDLSNGAFDNNFGNEGIIINYLFDNLNMAYDYLNFNDTMITCGFCSSSIDSSHPCLVKYLKISKLSIDDYQVDNLIAYPNPIDDFLYFESKINVESVDVLDYTGKFIQSHPIYTNSLNLSYLPKGFYILKAKNSNGNFEVKVVKK